MDQIQHRYVEVNGPKLHVAEIGTGPTVVVFLHGFPEIWYTWRHQMIAVANAGYRALAPDYSGYGLSDPPPDPGKASFLGFVNDIVAILDFLNIPKVFLVGKDFGSPVANFIAILHPKRVLGEAMHKLFDIPDPKVEALSLLITGQEDYVLKFPGIEDYIKSGEVKKFVPNLETIYLPQGSHFVHEQFPDQVNQLILTFLDSHVQSI